MHKVEKAICKAITGTEFEGKTYIVGGFVRDKVMGIDSDDIDVVVALPEGGLKLAEFLHQKGVSSRPVAYDNFGTAMVEILESKVEFVMTRKEIYQDKNRKPEVENGTLEEDVYRRDFTINSLLLDVITGEILDVSGKGIDDIENGVIRSTSEPDLIFREDPLRMLRAVRFASRFGFEIEEDTIEGIKNNAAMLQHISWERKRDEFTKMLTRKNPIPAMKMLIELGLMEYVVPEILEIIDVEQDKHHDLDVWNHTLRVIENIRPTFKLHLIALLHDIGKARVKTEDKDGIHFYKQETVSADMAEMILQRLKYPNELIKEISLVIRNHMRLKGGGETTENISDRAIRRLMMQTGDALDLLLELIHADNISHARDYSLPRQVPNFRMRLEKIKEEMKGKMMPLTGNTLMNYFKLNAGKEIGKLLDRATELWLENPEMNSDEILIKLDQEVQNGKQ
ncbi:MAG: hypothetical protein B1H06_01830 [Candidatus Cloacimonas sp. 4484_143]|nr:MAG: hypothetical protein B1H06_01830 [Candidatus Cloacimonas sp. 4484_143]RLC51295.1 MAG: hypothetical protein DRH79_06395 [Candidatus Cloacimonadota bacterium]